MSFRWTSCSAPPADSMAMRSARRPGAREQRGGRARGYEGGGETVGVGLRFAGARGGGGRRYPPSPLPAAQPPSPRPRVARPCHPRLPCAGGSGNKLCSSPMRPRPLMATRTGAMIGGVQAGGRSDGLFSGGWRGPRGVWGLGGRGPALGRHTRTARAGVGGAWVHGAEDAFAPAGSARTGGRVCPRRRLHADAAHRHMRRT